MELKRMTKKVDWTFVLALLVLLTVDLIVLTSASINVVDGQPYYIVKKQLLWITGGLVLMALVTLFWDYRNSEKVVHWLYLIAIVLLIGVLFMPEQKGAHRWYDLGFTDLQPSELGKLIMILAFAYFLSKREKEMWEKRTLLTAILFMMLPAALVFIEPDLGTSLVYFMIFLGMVWVGGIRPRVMVIALGVIAVAILLFFTYLGILTDGFNKPLPDELPGFIPLKSYQVTRLIIFMNPYMDPLNTGYHMIQSEVAIGSGGIFGKGWEQGSQVQGDFLPEHHTDFIFSVVGEEFGFAGSIALLGLYLFILWRAAKIAINAKDPLGRLIVTGVVSMLAFQLFINVGMTIGIMPITGIPMPFLSYGGSAMMVNLLAMGLILNVQVRSREEIF